MIFLIILCFGLIGYFYKDKLKKEYDMLKSISDYLEFLEANIWLFKNNIVEINNNFIITQKNKSAKNIYFKQNIIDNNPFKEEILNTYINSKEDIVIINSFFERLGQNEYDFETNKIYNFKSFINKKCSECKLRIKNKGDLFFKIMLAVGAVVAILIW